MKIYCEEDNTGFWFTLQSEGSKDAAFITRFGLNSINAVQYKGASVQKDGEFKMQIAIKSSKRGSGLIQRKI